MVGCRNTHWTSVFIVDYGMKMKDLNTKSGFFHQIRNSFHLTTSWQQNHRIIFFSLAHGFPLQLAGRFISVFIVKLSYSCRILKSWPVYVPFPDSTTSLHPSRQWPATTSFLWWHSPACQRWASSGLPVVSFPRRKRRWSNRGPPAVNASGMTPSGRFVTCM